MDEGFDFYIKNTGKTGREALIPKAVANDTTFRLLIAGSENVIGTVAREMKRIIFSKYKIKQLKIHHAVVVTEEIAHKLGEFGLHAVLLCVDASNSMSLPNLQETLKHLDFGLLSTSMFIMNLVQPQTQLFPTIVHAVEKLSLTYNARIVNCLIHDSESLEFSVSRISTAALQSARFLFGHETPVYRNIDFAQFQ